MAQDELAKLKKDYEKLRKKYKLPKFQELNEDFGIERLADYENVLLLKNIRKTISEKMIDCLRFLELLLHPMNAPLFFLALAKGMSQADKKKAQHVYERLLSLDLEAFMLELVYNEKAEAEFIKKSFDEWQKLKQDLYELVANLRNSWNKETTDKEKSYYG